MTKVSLPECLVYCPLPYNGRGPAQSCVQIVENFPKGLFESKLFFPKSRSVVSGVTTKNAFPGPLKYLPWKYTRKFAIEGMNYFYKGDLKRENGRAKISYIWPSPTHGIIEYAKRTGSLTVREMINSYRGTSKRILDHAFELAGLAPSHTVSAESVEEERLELSKYDYVFSSNDEVDKSLIEAGIPEQRILRSTFGWNSRRFNYLGDVPKSDKFTVVFVGTIGVRKGALQLLQAWTAANLPGELVMIGHVEPHFEPLAAKYAGRSDVKLLPFSESLERLYKSSHVFAFPTFEEGGPQVTYEAAGCGLPTVTTTMGAGRMIEHERNGLIVPAGDVEALARALVRLFDDRSFQAELGLQAKQDALRFTYDNVGQQRAVLLHQALSQSQGM